MSIVLLVTLIATTAVCVVGFLKYYISTLALVYYIKKKWHTEPDAEDIRECAIWAVKKMLKK